jgi:hypothetical protein
MKTKINFIVLTLIIAAGFFLIFDLIIVKQAEVVSAAEKFQYVPLENIPGSENITSKPVTFYQYIYAIYKFGIWTVGIVAIFMIIFGGYTYITSAGNNSSMETAKKIITDAIVGLIMALTAYLLLYVINPDLVRISTSKLPSVTTMTSISAPAVSCLNIPSQVRSQCADASPDLTNLLSCVYQKTGGKIQISSISDGNGGLRCYQNHPNWPQCTKDVQSNCCFHGKKSCHYGGTCSDGAHSVDFSDKGSAATNSQIREAVKACGGRSLDEKNHVHATIGNCGCDVNLQ